MPSEPSDIPTRFQLLAALSAGRLIDADGTAADVARDSYGRTPNGGRFGVRDLIAGEALLRRLELVENGNGVLHPNTRLLDLRELEEDAAAEALLAIVLAQDAPLWLGVAASGDELRPELIPTAAADVLENVIPDFDQREAFLLALGRRVDTDERSRIGGLAEDHVVEAARSELAAADRSDLAEQVQRLSRISDQLGYDVTAPTLVGPTRHLEVKGTRNAGKRLEVFVSRNEAKIGLADLHWALVVCRVGEGDVVEIVGWCRASAFEEKLPEDRGTGRWQSVKLVIPADGLHEGLPPIGPE